MKPLVLKSRILGFYAPLRASFKRKRAVCEIILKLPVHHTPHMDTVIMQKYLICGADSDGVTEANRLWGNGTLNVYDVFERLRGN